MLSKMLPWDFVAKFPATLPPEGKGLYVFLVEDPFLERVLYERLPKSAETFSLYSGREITREFVENELLNLSFFSSTAPVHVVQAESITPSHLLFLGQAAVDWTNQTMVMFFGKSSKAFIDFTKLPHVHGLHLELPRFWEGPKLWQFCQKMRAVSLPSEVSHFVLENLEHTFESFLGAIDTIKLHFQDEKVDLSKLKLLMTKERWDFFELIELFHRRPKSFFEEILKKEGRDFEFLRSLFAFMQGHLVKILFPEELQKKSKLSKYDQGILTLSEECPRDEVLAYLALFSEMEIMAKSQDAFLIDKLRLNALKF